MTSQTLKKLKIVAFVAFIIGASYGIFFGQQINAIQSKCPSPNQLTSSSVRALADGNILHTPCSVGASVFTGAVDFSGATITGAVTGTGTTNYIPRWTDGANGVLGNTPFSWNGTLYSFNNTAGNTDFQFVLTPTLGSGQLTIGRFASSGTSLNINDASSTLTATSPQIALDSGGGITDIGDVNGAVNITKLNINDGNQHLIFSSTGSSFLELLPQTGLYQIGDIGGVANSTYISINDAAHQIVFNSGVLNIPSTCVGATALDASGEADISSVACYAFTSGSRRVFLTGIDTTGILTYNGAGVIVSSAGAADLGQTVQYWIIDNAP